MKYAQVKLGLGWCLVILLLPLCLSVSGATANRAPTPILASKGRALAADTSAVWSQVVSVTLGSMGYNAASCAIDDSAVLYCWGKYPKCGLSFGPAPVVVSDLRWNPISAGDEFFCGATINGSIYCLGCGQAGQLGRGEQAESTSSNFTEIVGGSSWLQVSAGYYHTCAIKADDQTAWCWGAGINGQLGNGGNNATSVPTAVADSDAWRQISAGGSMTCGIKAKDDSLWCWGDLHTPVTGNETSESPSTPTTNNVPKPVNGGGSWQSISAGGTFICGTRADGTAWCWADSNPVKGPPQEIKTGGPEKIATTSFPIRWSYVVAGAYNACGVQTDHTGYCWESWAGVQPNIIITPIPGNISWMELDVGGQHTCGVTTEQEVMCWGYGGDGELGDGTYQNSDTPVLVPGLRAMEYFVAEPGPGPSPEPDTTAPSPSPPPSGGSSSFIHGHFLFFITLVLFYMV